MTITTTTTPAVSPSPYKGLRPFTEDDASVFFGRDRERDVIIANLQARRLILLYGASGVGKTSLVRAGVAARLRELAEQDREELGAPDFIPVLFSRWRDEPVAGLLTEIRESLSQLAGEVFEAEHSLVGLIEAVAGATRSSVVVILDQFEEYFFYHPRAGEDFEKEFVNAVNRPGLPVGFLVSIRDDALGTFDYRFKQQIPTLFDYALRVNPLDVTAGAEAIRCPIEQYNKQARCSHEENQSGAVEPEFVPVTVADDLVKAVLDQVRVGRVVLDQEGRGMVNGRTTRAAAGDFIEAPYLQLVMERLWDTEIDSGSRRLRLSTLTSLGGADTIIKTHLNTTLKGLSRGERDVAADVLRFLVTPSGNKVALDADALADYSERSREEVVRVLDSLASGKTRILRCIESGHGDDSPARYEIFHDLLAAKILDWRLRHLQERRERRLRLGGYLVALAAAAIVAAVFVFLVLPGKSQKITAAAASINTPRPEAQYAQNSLVRANYSCHAATGAQIISCGGLVPDGRPIDTASTGQKVFQVRLTERTRTGAKRAFPYDVPYVVVPATYDHGQFRAALPPGWLLVENGHANPGYTRTEWLNPHDRQDVEAVDVSPASGLSPVANANYVRSLTAPSPGYREVSFGRGPLGQRNSAEWIFQLPGVVKVDYFFSQCGRDIAAIGSTTPDRFAALLLVFDRIDQSLQVVCRS